MSADVGSPPDKYVDSQVPFDIDKDTKKQTVLFDTPYNQESYNSLSHDVQDNNGNTDETKYIKDVFTRACIRALQAESYGAWIHLIEILELIKPLSAILVLSKRIQHYLNRILLHCQDNPNIKRLNVISAFKDAFPDFDFDLVNSSPTYRGFSRSTLSPSPPLRKSPEVSQVRVPRVIFANDANQNVFKVLPTDLCDRVYQPKPLVITDLQCHLPQVVLELTKLECMWSRAMGTTLGSLNTDLPQVIHPYSAPPSADGTISRSSSEIQKTATKPFTPKTGKEVVEHLVRTPRLKEVQVWYLNFVPSVIYSPYNLVVANKHTVKQEHVVISVFGVLHVKANGESSLIPLSRWYNEALYFDSLKKIGFYKNFPLIKSMLQWRRQVRYIRFSKMRKNIENIYLFSVPCIPPSFAQILRLIDEYCTIDIFPKIAGVKSIEEYSNSVTHTCNLLEKYMRRLSDHIQDILQRTQENCIDYVRYCQAQILQNKPNIKESMTIAKKRTNTLRNNMRRAIQNTKSLVGFATLINVFLHSKLVMNTIEKIKDFTYVWIKESRRFSISSKFDFDTDCLLQIIPTESEVNSCFDWLFDTVLSNLDSILTKNVLPKVDIRQFTDVLSPRSKESVCSKEILPFDQLKELLSGSVQFENEMVKIDEREDYVDGSQQLKFEPSFKNQIMKRYT